MAFLDFEIAVAGHACLLSSESRKKLRRIIKRKQKSFKEYRQLLFADASKYQLCRRCHGFGRRLIKDVLLPSDTEFTEKHQDKTFAAILCIAGIDYLSLSFYFNLIVIHDPEKDPFVVNFAFQNARGTLHLHYTKIVASLIRVWMHSKYNNIASA